jgi:hypothetical protein
MDDDVWVQAPPPQSPPQGYSDQVGTGRFFTPDHRPIGSEEDFMEYVQGNIPTQLGQGSNASAPFAFPVERPLVQPLPVHHVVQNVYLPYVPSQLHNYEELHNYVHGNHTYIQELSAKVSKNI